MPLLEDSSQYDKQYKRFLIFLVIASACFVYAAVPAYHVMPLVLLSGVMLIVSEALLLRLSIISYRINKEELSIGTKILVWTTIIYNICHILYGCLLDDNYVALSYWGNSIYQPSFLLPFGLLLGLRYENFFQALKYVTLYSLFFIISFFTSSYALVNIGLGFLFVFAYFSYIPKKWRIAILIAGGLYLVVNYYYGGRTAIVRVSAGVLIYIATQVSSLWGRRVRTIIFCLGLLTPMLMVWAFVRDGFSIFEYAESNKFLMMDIEKAGEGDTRTFLYQEVFDDLTNNDAWTFGKGINGKYYSDYFASKHTDSGDNEERIQSEVGFLNILLKGGQIQTVLYTILLALAVYNSFFRSNSKFMLILGLILLTHFVLLFMEEYIKYDLYNILIWMLIGMALSPSCLEKDDDYFEEQLNTLFN